MVKSGKTKISREVGWDVVCWSVPTSVGVKKRLHGFWLRVGRLRDLDRLGGWSGVCQHVIIV